MVKLIITSKHNESSGWIILINKDQVFIPMADFEYLDTGHQIVSVSVRLHSINIDNTHAQNPCQRYVLDLSLSKHNTKKDRYYCMTSSFW